MKIGNTVNGLTVVDVKRVNKMNLIQFTKAVSEYIEQGYKIDVHSSRQIGLVLQCDVYKLESNLSGNVGSVGYVGDSSTGDVEVGSVGNNLKDEVVKEPNETTIEVTEESTEKLETVETVDDVKEGDGGTVSDETEVEVEQATPPEQNNAVVKKTRTKKTT